MYEIHPIRRYSRRTFLVATGAMSAVTGFQRLLPLHDGGSGWGRASAQTAGQAPELTAAGESVIFTQGQYNPNKAALKLNSHANRHDSILTHNGWQYAAAYVQIGNPEVDPDIRRVAVARRRLPDGEWRRVWLNDYDQVTDDNHNTIALGVCPQDGTLHLSFDHHRSALRYRRSVPGLVTNPDGPSAPPWNESSFGPIQDHLGGEMIDWVTYPRFLTTPSGELLFSYRQGRAQRVHDWHLHTYSGASGSWDHLGVMISGMSVNGTPQQIAYPNPFSYGPDGRLHMTWCWRRQVDPPPSEGEGRLYNHDLMYAFSYNDGRTWRNNDNEVIAETGTDDPIDQASPGIKVWDIPEGHGLINTEGQAVDSVGRVHVVMRDDLAGQTHAEYAHYVRPLNRVWRRIETGIRPRRRAKIVADPATDDMYIMDGALRISGATQGDPHYFGDWQVLYDDDPLRFGGDPQYDRSRVLHDGTLSVYYQDNFARPVRVLDFRFEPS